MIAPEIKSKLADLAQRVDEVENLSTSILAQIDREDLAFDVRSLGEEDEEILWALAWVQEIEPFSPMETESLRALTEQVEASEREIGLAFKDALLPDLPVALRPENIAALQNREVSQRCQAQLEHKPDVLAAGDAAAPLVKLGLSPLHVFYAVQAVADLVGRKLLRAQEEGETLGGTLDPEALLDEIVLSCNIDREVAKAVRDWLLEVAEVKRRLFPGFVAVATSETLHLHRDTTGSEDIAQRWRETGIAQDQAEAIAIPQARGHVSHAT